MRTPFYTTLIFFMLLTSLKADLPQNGKKDLLQSLYTNTPIGIGMVSERRLLYFNDYFLEMTGYSREELEGKHTAILYRSYEEFVSIDAVYSVLEDSGIASVETFWRRKTGDTIAVLLTLSAIDKRSHPPRVTFTAIDITESVESKRLLKKSEERFRSLFFNHTATMLLVDPSTGMIHTANPAAESFYGWSNEELQRMNISELNTLSPEEIAAEMADAKSKRRNFFEFIHRMADGSHKNVAVFTAPINFDNQPLLFSIIYDITEEKRAQKALKKQTLFYLKISAIGIILLISLILFLLKTLKKKNLAEKSLREAKKEAERANRAKSTFLANMSHEIRTPLNGIIGFSDAISKTELTEKQEQFISLIKFSGDRLLKTISDILDISKIEAEELKLERKTFKLGESIFQLQEIFRVQANKKGILFSLKKESPLPHSVEGDETRLIQILTNLLGNALKFTENGGITLSLSYEKGILLCSVSDTGIGMSDEEKSRIFKPFSQADTSISRRFGGTGLGLVISKYLAEAMGGEISFSSQKGVGTTFSLSLPLPQSEAIIEEKKGGSNMEKLTYSGGILIAEDDNTNMLLINLLIEEIFEIPIIYSATNGEEAVELYKKHKPQIVLLDIHMPIISGVEAAKMIQKEGFEPKPIIIALTADVESSHKEICLNAGFTDFLSKPLEPGRVQQLLREYTKDL